MGVGDTPKMRPQSSQAAAAAQMTDENSAATPTLDEVSEPPVEVEDLMADADNSSKPKSSSIFPLSRINKIMKLDLDVTQVSSKAVMLTAAATVN